MSGFRCSLLIALFAALAIATRAQQPTPTPSPHTGRSYSADALPKTPPIAGPKGQSPVTFTDITAQTKIDFRHQGSPTSIKYLLETMGGGVAIFDYDNDGHVDLYVTGYGENHLYHNNGNGTFTDVAKKLGVNNAGWSTSAGWIDYDRDGRWDLFVAR